MSTMRVVLSSAVVALLAALVTGCGGSAPAAFSADTTGKLQQLVEQKRTDYNLPGVIVGVWIPGQGEWVYASGVSDTATGKAITFDDKTRIASITKSFTATVVLQLIQEGKLSFDTTLDTFAPYVPLADQITVRQLLNHTSGLFTYSGATFTTTLLNDPKTVWTPRQLVDLGISQPASGAPGEKYSYSNTNYILLGTIIEQVTGKKVEDEVRARILQPLGMSASSFPSTGTTTIAAPFSHGYWPLQDGGLQDITELDPSSHWTSGGIICNARDLRTWGEALARGTLVSPKMQSERLTWQKDPNVANKFYGLGIMRYGEFLGHDGTMPGYESLVFYLPSRGATFVVLANTMGKLPPPQEEIFKGMVELLIPEAKAW